MTTPIGYVLVCRRRSTGELLERGAVPFRIERADIEQVLEDRIARRSTGGDQSITWTVEPVLLDPPF